MSLADQFVERSLADQAAAYTGEVQQLIEAAHVVISVTGNFDPPIRSILAEAGLSNPAFYRHFRSKDELLLVMLDEGRRRLVSYLDHRIAGAASDEDRLAEWVRGVLAQAADPDAAQRTRPFVTAADRLHEKFPAEQEASERQLVDQLSGLLPKARVGWAQTIYSLVLGELGRHLRGETPPSSDEVEALVRFVLAGAAAASP